MGGLVHRAAGCVGVGNEDVYMVTIPGGKAVEGDAEGTWGSRRQLGPRIRRPPKDDPFGVVQPDPSLVGEGWCNRYRIVWSLIEREGGGGQVDDVVLGEGNLLGQAREVGAAAGGRTSDEVVTVFILGRMGGSFVLDHCW